MKSLEELGASPEPWTYENTPEDGMPFVHDKDENAIAERFVSDMDARLIAAAPELYDALRHISEAFCNACWLRGKSCDTKPCPKIKECRDALKKAGGAE